MAIDVSVFGKDLPAGTYSVGDMVELGIVSGPANVRSGRGAAYLKRISSMLLSDQSGSKTLWKINVKNSDWIDDSTSISSRLTSPTSLDKRSGAVCTGHDCPLTSNSGWIVTAECVGGATTTVGNSIAAVIEVDYPEVSGIVDPDLLVGVPASISHKETGVTINAPGTLQSAMWNVYNVDIFKAGYEYALEKMELITGTNAVTGFVAISNAAGMGGLTRIVPICDSVDNIRPLIEYASRLVKGPMDIKYMLFNNGGSSATTDSVELVMDYVKRRK